MAVADPVLEATDLAKRFAVGRGWHLPGRGGGRHVQAVDGVSLTLAAGETLGIVGESGCGKSTLARLLVALETPDRGMVRIAGTAAGDGAAARREARRRVQMVFQDPYTSLNPRLTVLDLIAEPLDVHRLVSGAAARRRRVEELLLMVGLDPAQASRYPHEFSGGQRQRIGIARALACDPEVLICDEAVSALDVSVQAQIVNLLVDLQRRLGVAIVFIAHDLAVVRQIAHRVIVMYLGRVVETGPADRLFDHPRHPYTAALRAAVPEPDPRLARRRGAVAILGEPPSPLDPPSGCPYHPRCQRADATCRTAMPPLATGPGGGAAACHHPVAG